MGSASVASESGAGVGSPIYIGQEYDPSTAYNYLNARYMSSSIGRFISEDPVFLSNPSIQDISDPQNLNSYTYAINNPVSRKDPSGRCLEDGCVLEGIIVEHATIGLVNGLVGVGALGITDYYTGHKDSLQDYAGTFTGSFVAGALTGVPSPGVGTLFSGAAFGIAGGIVQGITADGLKAMSGQSVTLSGFGRDEIQDAGYGGLFNGIGSEAIAEFAEPLSNVISSSVSEILQPTTSGIRTYAQDYTAAAANYYGSKGSPYVGGFVQSAVQNVVQDNPTIPQSVQSAGQSATFGYIQQEINFIQSEINHLPSHH